MTDEEKSKEMLKKTSKMLRNLRDLAGKMEEIEDEIRGTLNRHVDTIMEIDVAGNVDAKVDALLDISLSMARAQVLSLSMARKQLDLSLFDMIADEDL